MDADRKQPETPASPRSATLAATVAVGLGVGPTLAALQPWSPAALAGAALGALVIAPLALRREAGDLAREAETGVGRHGAGAFLVQATEASLGTLAALLALHLVALAGAGLVGQATGTSAVLAWDARMLRGPAGWTLQPDALAAWLVVAVLGTLLAHRRRPAAWAAGLAAAALVAQVPLALRALFGQHVRDGLVSSFAAVPTPASLGALAIGTLAGGLLGGILPGLLGARCRLDATGPAPVRLTSWLPLAVVPGLLAALPLAPDAANAPYDAPAPHGRMAAVVLGGALPPGWHAAWEASLLLAGLAGLVVATQPARAVLQGRLGLGPGAAASAHFALLVACGLPLQVLPGAPETLPALVAALALLLAALRLLSAHGLARRALGVLALAALGFALHPDAGGLLRPPQAPWDEAALQRARLLAPGLALLLAALFWPAVLGLGAWRARAIRRRAAVPAAPGSRPARA